MNEIDKEEKDVFDKTIEIGKKLLRYSLYGIVGLISISLLVWGISAVYTYQTETKHERNVVIKLEPDQCSEPFPIDVTIINNSKRTIENIVIHPEARREGYSNDLADYARIESDKIIPPEESYRFCWDPKRYLDGTAYKPQDLIWEPIWYSIEFK